MDVLNLQTEEWMEQARWIKYEQNAEEEAGRWSKPHVSSLSFHSLIELRKCIEYGEQTMKIHAELLRWTFHVSTQTSVTVKFIYGFFIPLKSFKLLTNLPHLHNFPNTNKHKYLKTILHCLYMLHTIIMHYWLL